MEGQKETWTIGELVEHAAALLGPATQSNGRVRDVPNERLIRWYVTIGLLDPPLARRGRIALYGPRHLLQLVAIKRRQASGASIAEIQLELAGAPDATLQSIAALPHPSIVPLHYSPHADSPHPDGAHLDEPHSEPHPASSLRRADIRFWTSA